MEKDKKAKFSVKLSFPNIIFGLLIGVLLGIGGFMVYENDSERITRYIFYGLVVSFVLVALTFIVFWIFKNYLTRLIFGEQIANAPDLITEAQKFSNELLNQVVERIPQNIYKGDRALAKGFLKYLSNFLIWGRLRNWWWTWLLGIFATLGGVMSTVLLMKQNELLSNQNQLVVSQNQLIQNQMSLEEASRRGSLVMLMSNIFDKVDDEIAEQRMEMRRKGLVVTDSTKFSISQSLIGQIAALSQAFKPYRYMDGDTLIGRPLSPERGQLLVTITRLPLDIVTLERVFAKSTFEESYLRGVNLRRVNMRRVKLSGADLTGADLIGADLSGANLIGADLAGAYMLGAGITDTYLRGADLSGSYLTIKQLISSSSLYECKLPENIDMVKLKKLKPVLFNKPELDVKLAAFLELFEKEPNLLKEPEIMRFLEELKATEKRFEWVRKLDSLVQESMVQIELLNKQLKISDQEILLLDVKNRKLLKKLEQLKKNR